jgi:hypothetical protein
MINFLKRQWLRLKSSWEAFRVEWRFNFRNRSDQQPRNNPFVIMGLGRLKDPADNSDPTFDLHPPYYGSPIVRLDGRVFTLKYMHFNPTTSVVRYLDTDKPSDGFVVLDANWLEDKND